MKKILIAIFFVVLVIIGITTFFVLTRDGGGGWERPRGSSDIKGYVLSQDESSFLVAEGLIGNVRYDGDIERLDGKAIVFQVTEETEVFSSSGEKVSYSDLNVHDEVEVWSTGVIREVYPAQAEADLIKVTGSVLTLEEEREPTVRICDDQNSSRLEIIQALESVWGDIEIEIPERPSLGATNWHTPYHAQFIGNNTIMIAFEDGHTVATAILSFACEEDGSASNFRVQRFVGDFPLDEQEWTSLRRSLGNRTRSPNTYTSIPVYVEGQMIDADGWSEITPNIFIMDTGSGHKL